jgi:hypothetical protein
MFNTALSIKKTVHVQCEPLKLLGHEMNWNFVNMNGLI